jgi:cation diffusion facilitator CzcD-associated flavoprotein CzcO
MTASAASAERNGSDGGLRDVRVAIIGAGFGGLGVAIKLHEAGVDEFLVLERDEGLGGTWWANTYPGCACDVPAHLYSYSFQLNPTWSRMFAPQPEILEYLRRTARERGIVGHLRFGTNVHGARWDEEAQLWHVDTSRGSLRAQVLVAAAGGLVEPKYPDIRGLADFQGACFHSARWDHGHDLRGERVGVIGTGASAAQFIPEVQKQAARLTIFQRTPGWVIPRLDHPHSDMQKRAFARFPLLQRAVRSSLYYSAEGLVLGLVYDQRLLIPLERIARRHLEKQVPDPEVRARLTPNFRIGCKRIMFSNDYLRSYAEPNVELVSDGIREIVADGVITNSGRHVELDTIVLGTGFNVFDPPHASGVVGRDGRTLKEKWSDGGIRAYLGTAVANFPNHFMVMGPNTGLGNNSMINVIEAHAGFIVDALKTMDAQGLASVEVREDVEERYNRDIQARLEHTVWNEGGCRSWYVGPDGRNHTLWPSFSNAFKRRLARFDEADFITRPGNGGRSALAQQEVRHAGAEPSGSTAMRVTES